MADVKFKYRYNTDDIFIRILFASLTENLTNRLSYKQIEDDNTQKTIKVPFYLRATGDERFLSYHFTGKNYENCEEKIEGSIDVIPRGIISFESPSISREYSTSPKAIGEFSELDDSGNLKSYRAEISSVPLAIPFNLKIVGDTLAEIWKIFQNLLEEYYYNSSFEFMYKGIVCTCNVNFPDSIQMEGKTFEFSYGSNLEKPSLNITLDMVAYMPIINQKTKYSKSKVITSFETTYSIKRETELVETKESGILSGKIKYSNGASYTANLVLLNRKNEIVSYTNPNYDGEYIFVNTMTGINYKLKDNSNTIVARGITILNHSENNVDIELD